MAGISQAALARELGVNRSTITYHVKRGLTFDQIRELVTALKKIREEDEEEEDDDGENDENSIAFLRKKKIREEIKLKHIQAEQARIKLEKDKGKLVDMEDVNELMVHTASVTKSVFQSLENKLPGKLEGLTAAEMVPVLREEVESSLFSIAEEVRSVIKMFSKDGQ
ncbi:winged helix-turn-helix transcriptional regulator [Akkermansia muciniphila]|nr:helix-turn-helix domain-containing protein [Candidatus Akkermansia timonensis]MBT9561432.1 winged helix-turn-helix transcriptional regulator [Candidatus Akkermansia timonensis]MBT9599693.1 winged helix-turn-helix transcriptional regulator [Akkermansia muciniphila]